MRAHWIKRTLILLLTGGLLGLLGLTILVQSDLGRSWARTRILQWVEKEYRLSIQYASLEIRPSKLGWQLDFRDFQWSYIMQRDQWQANPPKEHIEELQLIINPWKLFLDMQPVSSVLIKGTQLKMQLTKDSLQSASAGWELPLPTFERSGSSLLSLGAWPDVTIENAQVELEYRPDSVTQLIQLSLSGAWTSSSGLTQLQLKSSTLELMPSFQQFLPMIKKLGVQDEASAFDVVVHQFKRGRIEDLQLSCPSLKECQGSAHLRNLQWSPKDWIPGVRDLSLRAELKAGQLLLFIPHAPRILDWPTVYRKPVHANFSGTRLEFSYDSNQLMIHIPTTMLNWNDLSLAARAKIQIPWLSPKETKLALTLETSKSSWATVQGVLPDTLLGPQVMLWLQSHLRQGQLKNIHAELDGTLRNFPFEQGQAGKFLVSADFNHLQVRSLEPWRTLDQCQGRFSLKQAEIFVKSISCQTGGLQLSEGEFALTGLRDVPQIKIGFQAQGSWASSLKYLQRTPLQTIPQLSERLGLQARRQSTRIDLTSPLVAEIKERLELMGRTEIQFATLNLPRDILSGTTEQIALEFDQKGLKSLNSLLTRPEDKTRIKLQRDPAEKFLDMTLEGVDAKPDALRGKLRLSPADGPQRLEGFVSGLQLAKGAARVDIERLTWQSGEGTTIKGLATIQNFGAIGPIIGLDSSYEAGHGTVHFDLMMPDSSQSLGPEQLKGTLDIDLADGRIHRLSSTATSLIHMANLKVFGIASDSVSYSFLRGRLTFAQGSLHTDDVGIDLGAIEVHAKGSINYPTDSLQMHLQIVPDLGSPAASVAIGLWNPLLGLYLFGYSRTHDKASDSRLNRMISQHYRMKGSIDNPEISLIKVFDLKEITR